MSEHKTTFFSFIKLHHSLSSCIYAWFYTDRTGAKDESRTKTADRSGTWSPGSSSTKSRTESKWARVSLPRTWRPRTFRSSSHMRARRKCEQADRSTKRRTYTENATGREVSQRLSTDAVPQTVRSVLRPVTSLTGLNF